MTYSDLKSDFLDSTGNPGSTDTTLVAFFDRHLSTRYQDLLSQLPNYTTQGPDVTITTEDEENEYDTPSGVLNLESANIDIGDENIPLQVVNSQLVWDHLTAILIEGWPTHIFPKRDTFELWPTPDDEYTVNFAPHIRDRSLTTADVTTTTVTVVNGDATVTHVGTSFVAGMVGRWFKVDTDGYWYRIASFTSTSVIELGKVYEGTSAGGLAYVIGESPELPEETHIALSYGATADYFRGPRKDRATANDWEKRYDKVVNRAIKKYASRSDKRLIKRNMAKRGNENVSWLWSKTLTS